MGVLACSLAALLLVGGGGGAGERGRASDGPKYMDTVVQDDAALLHRSPASVARNMRQIADLGATTVRLTASWSSLTQSPRTSRRPAAGFEPTDTSTYPDDAFDGLDTAVRDAHADGLDVMIDVAFWAPLWAVTRRASNPLRERYWVRPSDFADFATAVARRYDGSFTPRGASRPLPAVRTFTPWNEPNHPSFLAPQWTRAGDGSWRPESPHIYRAMYDAAYAAIKAVDGDDKVLLGGLASIGSPTPGRGGVPPLDFVRAMACVDDKLLPLEVPECRGFAPLRADGFALHPYRRYDPPGTSDDIAGDASIDDVDRLSELLARLEADGRIVGHLPIDDTEFGYETHEDDPYAPFTREQQAQFIGWSTFLAYRNPDTQMFAQFLLRDIDPAESGHTPGTASYYRDWQSGLYAADGSPKPAVAAFRQPFWAQTVALPAGGRAVQLFGEIRPGRGERTVRVEREGGDGSWAPVATTGPRCEAASTDHQFTTDAAGFFERMTPFVGAASYRLGWQQDDGSWTYGATIPVADAPGVVPEGLRARSSGAASR